MGKVKNKVNIVTQSHMTCVVSPLSPSCFHFLSVSVMTTTSSRTSSDLVQISRAEQRKQRLRELETEQAAEEAEALKMTEVNCP